MRILVTGSSGLVGSQAVAYFARRGHDVLGIDCDLRRVFFGAGGDTGRVTQELIRSCPGFVTEPIDVRDREAILSFVRAHRPDAIVHCAAQPSHELSAQIPVDDFDINAVGTVNLLEAGRRFVAASPFVFLSTNKVYGDAPNELPLEELPTRWEYQRLADRPGISESCRVDRCLHSPFGASKLAADVLVQEYGRYFGMPTVVLRPGCITGPQQAGGELHGFLNHLIRTVRLGRTFRIYGYKGKQVRDQIHALDVCRAIDRILAAPRSGEVYNIGGGRANSISVLEAIERIATIVENRPVLEYVARPRLGDHICYISDTRKLERDYPGWTVEIGLDTIVAEQYAQDGCLSRERIE
jgi:CDP-paratose 2-epimerase